MRKVVVTNASSTTSLGIIRSLGRRGVFVIASDSVASSVGFTSRYCRERFLYEDPAESPRECVAALVDMGEKFDKPVLLPGGDDIIFLIMKYRNILEKAFILPFPSNRSLAYSIDKELTLQLALKEAIPIPRTFVPSTIEELEVLKDEFQYPMIIKPRINVGKFRIKFEKKALLVWSFKQLTDAYSLICKFFQKPLVQEYVPGGVKDVYSLDTIFDWEHNPLGVRLMRRSHQLVEGISSRGDFLNDQEPINLGVKLLRAMKWIGPAEVEFKKDPRDGEFKILEVNPRPTMLVNFSVLSGLDIPFLWYKLAVGGRCDKVGEMGGRCYKYINLWNYLFGAVRELSSNERAVLGRYLRGLKGSFIFDILSKDDALPFFAYPFLFVVQRIKERINREKLSLDILQT